MGANDVTQTVNPIAFFGLVFILGAAVLGAARHRGETWWTAVPLGVLSSLTMVPFLSFVFPRATGVVRIAAVLLITALLLVVIVLKKRRR